MVKSIKRFFKKWASNVNIREKIDRVGPEGGCILPRPGDPKGKDMELRLEAGKVVDGMQPIIMKVNGQATGSMQRPGDEMGPGGEISRVYLNTRAPDMDVETVRAMEELEKNTGTKR